MEPSEPGAQLVEEGPAYPFASKGPEKRACPFIGNTQSPSAPLLPNELATGARA